MDKKPAVMVLYGGKSVEHEVSVHSAADVCKTLSAKYNVLPVLVGKDGMWYLQKECGAHKEDDVKLTPVMSLENKFISFSMQGIEADIVFPVLHGTGGEDGVLQGLLELLDIPYVGCGVAASAMGMDKEVAKILARENGASVLDYEILHDKNNINFAALKKRALQTGLPVFVKPNTLGSSVGVSKVADINDLEKAVNEAFRFDNAVMVEKGVDKAREIFCAILSFPDGRAEASKCGELVPTGSEFFDYHTKYEDPNGCIAKVPADIPAETEAEMQKQSLAVFKAMRGTGLARVDFLMDGQGKFYFSEINSMPGMSEGSLYPQLWRRSGREYAEVLDILLQDAQASYKLKKIISTEKQ